MSAFAFMAQERVDEWGTFFIDVNLMGVRLFTLDTGGPRPTTRSAIEGAHETAMTQFANRLQRAISD